MLRLCRFLAGLEVLVLALLLLPSSAAPAQPADVPIDHTLYDTTSILKFTSGGMGWSPSPIETQERTTCCPPSTSADPTPPGRHCRVPAALALSRWRSSWGSRASRAPECSCGGESSRVSAVLPIGPRPREPRR
jgi:hypothetical protein